MRPSTHRLLEVRAYTQPLMMALLLTLTVGPTATLVAQDVPMSRTERLAELFGGLSTDLGLRVVTVAGLVEEGRLRSTDGTGFGVARDGRTFVVGYRDVRSVEVQGGHPVQGAIWGAAAGALVGVFFGAMYSSFDCTTAADCNYSETQGALRGAALIGGIGGGIGFYFGRKQAHWHAIFP